MNDIHNAGPAPVRTPQCWYGPDMARQPELWVHELTAEEVAGIEAAVARLDDVPILEIARAPLPGLEERLARIRQEVLHGIGFQVIRGLPAGRWTVGRAAAAFWLLGLHLGEAVSQNGKGHVLGHVRDLGLDYSLAETRGYQTNARLPYHTDESDLACLLCLRTAREGGLSSLVSSVTIWNEMVRRRPDLAAALCRPVARTRWGEVPAGRRPWAEVPVFLPWRGNVVTTYVRSAIEKARPMPGPPEPSALQTEAMDMIDALVADPALHLDMALEEGDLQIVSNHRILHSRTAYLDWEDPARKRHMLRLWLACADGPDLPPVMTEEYQEATASGRPNGIRVPGVPFSAPLAAN